MGDKLESCNVQTRAQQPGSMLSFYRRMMALRRRERCLALGGYAGLAFGPACLSFLRHRDDERILVLANFSAAARPIRLSDEASNGGVLLSTDADRTPTPVSKAVELKAA
jgi:glycosidase